MEPIQIGDLIRKLIVSEDVQSAEKTTMSIAGTAYLENIWSDIYGYYLVEQESHGLGTLFLKGLERIIKKRQEKLFRFPIA